MKLTSTLALALTITITVVLVGYGYLSIRRQLRLFEQDMIRDDRILGQVLSLALRDLWEIEGQERALAILHILDSEDDHLQVRWLWQDDPAAQAELTEEERRQLAAGVLLSGVDQEHGGRYLRTRVPLQPPGARPGYLEIADSLADRDAYVRATLQRLVALAVLVIALGSLVAWALGIWIVGRPVAALVEKARRVGEGDLEGPLELDQTDELGTLAREMNEMCRHLAEARAALENEEGSRRAAETQLQHAERLATIGKLASGIAHELGTPLNVIGGRATLIQDGDLEGEAAQESAGIIREQAEKISRTIRQLLAFSRRHQPMRAATDLGDLLRSSLALLEDSRGQHQIETALELPDEPVLAEVDGGQLQQVFVNIIWNAFQAMGDAGKVSIRLRRLEGTTGPPGHRAILGAAACIEVEDDGPGIDPGDLDHVFEPFFTTKDVGEGTGLGLSVAYGIVEEHGGWITVKSPPGNGATFWIVVPLEGDPAA